MKSDIEISRSSELLPIDELSKLIGAKDCDIEPYGRYKGKLSESFLRSLEDRPSGKLILVTAINPTPAGEGKTTTSIGLADAMRLLGKNTMLALREPSLGPCFGIKGGATGGGYSQIAPMDEINLHFTGDIHAVTTANNLCAALLDNHLHQGNEKKIDIQRIVLKRCLDLNDRALRCITVGNGKSDGPVREDGFSITVATELMAILCLSEDLRDLKDRLNRMIVAYDINGMPVTAEDIQASGAMAALLKDALKPNLVQTLGHTPALVHGGPFANIAHGCNSVRATKTALRLADYVITEAGFGADLGAEKFFDIKCRQAGIRPDACVLVATVRALCYNGGDGTDALKNGICNLGKHIENLQKFGLPVTVAMNLFGTEREEDISFVRDYCIERNCRFAISDVYREGGNGGILLAKEVLNSLEESSDFRLLYSDDLSVKEKIKTIAKEIYGSGKVIFSDNANLEAEIIENSGFGRLPVCIAKTQYSLSDDKSLLGRPEGFDFHIREMYVSSGAGFIVALSGNILTMPGLTSVPAAYGVDVDDEGNITGLY